MERREARHGRRHAIHIYAILTKLLAAASLIKRNCVLPLPAAAYHKQCLWLSAGTAVSVLGVEIKRAGSRITSAPVAGGLVYMLPGKALRHVYGSTLEEQHCHTALNATGEASFPSLTQVRGTDGARNSLSVLCGEHFLCWLGVCLNAGRTSASRACNTHQLSPAA